MTQATDIVPVLDMTHIVDMRGWIGEESFQGLIETVPDSFNAEVRKIQSGWQDGDLKLVRDTGHRLKGSASSLGCSQLAQLGFELQHLPDDGLTQTWRLDDLKTKTVEALAALLEYAQSPPPPEALDDE